MPGNKTLLIIHQGALGDFVLTFPVIAHLKKSFHRTDAVCRSELGILAVSLGVTDRWFPLESARYSSLYSDYADLQFVSLLSSYHTIVLFSFSIALQRSIEKAIGGTIYRIPPRPEVHHPIHVVTHMVHWLGQIGILDASFPETDIIPRRENNPIDIRKGSRILLHPGSGSTRKCWPLHRFLTLEASLRNMNLQPEFLIGPAETALSKELQKAHISDKRIHLTEDFHGLLKLLKRSAGLIGNDSGVSHLSAFLGRPTVAIFGPSDPRRWAPVGRAVQVVRPSLTCAPCFETAPVSCDDPVCLNNTPPLKVLEAFQNLIRLKQTR